MQEAVADFVASELGCQASRVVKLDAFPGNWTSPETVEACTMRNRYVRDTEEV